MKGIILAGGSGTRLYPITLPTIKQLLPVYNKPMIYYPLAALMHAGVREVLIISTPQDIDSYKKLFSDGTQLGIVISYAVQKAPNGIAEALIIGESFINNDSVWLILGDNIFFGHDFPMLVNKAINNNPGATVFGYYVADPERYGVVEFDKAQKVLSIEEKPKHPKSNYAVTGLYYYDANCVKYARSLKPSPRGELEITDLNNLYREKNALKVELMGRGYAWLDTGTYESLLEAGNYVRIIEKRQGLQIACIEEIAFRNGYISKEQLLVHAQKLIKNSYGQYLMQVYNETSF